MAQLMMALGNAPANPPTGYSTLYVKADGYYYCKTAGGTETQLSGISGGGSFPPAGVPLSTGTTWGASYTVGLGANNLVQLDSLSRLPAVDGSALTNVTATASTIPASNTSAATHYAIGGVPLSSSNAQFYYNNSIYIQGSTGTIGTVNLAAAGWVGLSGSSSGATYLNAAATAGGNLTLPAADSTILASVTAPAANPITGTPSSTTFLRGDGTWSASVGTVTHTGGNLTANSIVLGAGTADTKVVAGLFTDGVSVLTLGQAGTSVGGLALANATSGAITLSPPTGALGTVTVTIPAATDTLVNLAGSQALTNKTYNGNTLTAGSSTYTGTAAQTYTFPSSTDTIVGRASTDTLTNKRVTARYVSTTQSATPTINTDNTDVAYITGLAQAITSMTTNLSGTPNGGDCLLIEITDNGTARAITWGTSFESSTVTLPSTTVLSTKLTVAFLWNTTTTKWRCVGVA